MFSVRVHNLDAFAPNELPELRGCERIELGERRNR